ncbi:MAG: hypothetical protein U9N78_03950 [Actinomycetota bacterium]|nr:hypothetical protein [Actinomycetota bacterium]
MAVDLAGTVTYLKDHAVEHGFHVHDERHFVETYTLRQAWEVDLHPAESCEGPLDLHLAIDLDPRIVLELEDMLMEAPETPEDPDGKFVVPFLFNWGLPLLTDPPDLIVLSAELAGIGGVDLPIEVSAVDSFGALSDGQERRLSIIAAVEISLVDLMYRQDSLCETLDRVHAVSMYVTEHAPAWIG